MPGTNSSVERPARTDLQAIKRPVVWRTVGSPSSIPHHLSAVPDFGEKTAISGGIRRFGGRSTCLGLHGPCRRSVAFCQLSGRRNWKLLDRMLTNAPVWGDLRFRFPVSEALTSVFGSVDLRFLKWRFPVVEASVSGPADNPRHRPPIEGRPCRSRVGLRRHGQQARREERPASVGFRPWLSGRRLPAGRNRHQAGGRGAGGHLLRHTGHRRRHPERLRRRNRDRPPVRHVWCPFGLPRTDRGQGRGVRLAAVTICIAGGIG